LFVFHGFSFVFPIYLNENRITFFKLKIIFFKFSLEPSTTVLSPYLKFGSLSPRVFYYELKEIYAKRKHSQPPVSLHGQLLWREFFTFVGYNTPNFDRIEGNPICRQIPWDDNEEFLSAWRNGRTGFPFIDAIMTQLRLEGWIHHLARHAVACFLTRGDLYQSWTKGQEVFEGSRPFILFLTFIQFFGSI
jgi:cryptochrome